MSRFYVPKENIGDKEIIIEGKEAHHILDVMRLEEGDEVVVFDGTGSEYTGRIKNANTSNKKIIIEIMFTERPSREPIPEITLAQAIPKKCKIEYIIEKATELGVHHVIPIVSQRTIVRPHELSSKRKLERWQKIAVEASKQCGRITIPIIDKITIYKDLLARLDDYDLILLACLRECTIPIKEALKDFKPGKILVFIGPEGDFTAQEIEMIRHYNCKFITLGRRVLKSDTAGIFVLSVLNYEYLF